MAADALNERGLARFLAAFYDRLRADPVLGPVFDAAISPEDWAEHLGIIGDFWSSILFRSGRYRGNPFRVHVGKGIRADHFPLWLGHFEATALERFAEPDALQLIAKAHRIAESLQAGLFFAPESDKA